MRPPATGAGDSPARGFDVAGDLEWVVIQEEDGDVEWAGSDLQPCKLWSKAEGEPDDSSELDEALCEQKLPWTKAIWTPLELVTA
jgi:hypothetical protein